MKTLKEYLNRGIPFTISMEEVKTIMRSLPRDETLEVFYNQVTGSCYDERLDRLNIYWRASSSFYRVHEPL